MSDVSTFSAVQTNAEDESTYQQMLIEIEQLNGRMDQDRKEIERLKAESNLLKIETRAILATLGVGV